LFKYQGKTALITGASSGIGAEFVKVLAAKGMNLILVARSITPMEEMAADLSAKYGVSIHVVPADLSRAEAVAEIAARVTENKWNVDLLINNAGFMTYGPFEKIDPASDHAEIMVNIAALVGLTHAFLPAMLERRDGAVINVASIAGYQPIPYLTVYAATKAFVISFSVGLWHEARDRNVHILGLCPGTTSTELFNRADANKAAVGGPRTVEQVVATAIKALNKKRSLVVDGLQNTLMTIGPRFVPHWLAAQFAGKTVNPPK
jgi:hypothetical protein